MHSACPNDVTRNMQPTSLVPNTYNRITVDRCYTYILVLQLGDCLLLGTLCLT